MNAGRGTRLVPEIPDLTVYIEALSRRIVGQRLERVRVVSPFFLRTVDPPVTAAEGRLVQRITRVGKRIVFEMEGGPFLVVHLMIAGRFQWRAQGATLSLRTTNAVLEFPVGALHITEAGSRKRASLAVVADQAGVRALDPGGVEPLEVDEAGFAAALRRENHTLKRALTDPRIVSGIGNAYSDEILHRAGLAPTLLTVRLGDDGMHRLFEATRGVLVHWIDLLRRQVGDGFPAKVTAFHDEMAVHGRYGKPCPVCGSPVQRIVYAQNEANYCATCQTGGRLLKDRALSRLLREDWPRSLEEMDARLGRAPHGPDPSA
jgi:formamidopyrimidine-DNA glycosylase